MSGEIQTMKAEAGYTLVEMLGALMVIGLAFSGLVQAVHVISRYQAVTAQTLDRSRQWRAAEGELGRLLAQTQDIAALVGDERRFASTCGAAEPCTAALGANEGMGLLTLSRNWRRSTVPLTGDGFVFRYQALDGLHGTWPPAQSASRLSGVAIVRNDEAALPLAYVPVRERQPLSCKYDVLAGDCRKGRQ